MERLPSPAAPIQLQHCSSVASMHEVLRPVPSRGGSLPHTLPLASSGCSPGGSVSQQGSAALSAGWAAWSSGDVVHQQCSIAAGLRPSDRGAFAPVRSASTAQQLLLTPPELAPPGIAGAAARLLALLRERQLAAGSLSQQPSQAPPQLPISPTPPPIWPPQPPTAPLQPQSQQQYLQAKAPRPHDLSAVLALARRLVEVPGLASDLAAAVGAAIQQQQEEEEGA